MSRRPLCIATIIYIIGILIGLYLKLSIAFLLLLIFILISGSFVYIKKDDKKINKAKCIKIILLVVVILCLGIGYIKYIDNTYEKMYKKISSLEEIQVLATVISSPKEKDYSFQYQIKILRINGEEKYQGKEVILNIKKKKTEENIQLQYGDIVKILGEFKIPSEARNYGGFDYKQYLKTQKIYGTINSSEIEVVREDSIRGFEKIIYQVQNNIKTNMEKVLSDKTVDLCIGILIGDRVNLDDETEENFKNSNLTHMLAVSGAHISYIILGLSYAISKIDKKTSKIITILFLIFFMALTEFTPSVTRASIMAILMLFADLCYRKSDIFNNLAISTLVILLLNPYAILNIGFKLSYAGTIGIVLLDKKIQKAVDKKIKSKNKVIRYIIDSVVVTISANILIIPIMAYQFNTISLTFWISNLLAAPLMGTIVILGFVTYFVSLISISLAKLISIPLNFILILLSKIAEICAKLPFSSIIVKTPYLITILIYYFILLIILNHKILRAKLGTDRIEKQKRMIKKFKLKIYRKWKNERFLLYIQISIIISILLFTSLFISGSNEKLKLYFIDVGQGDSCLIVTPGNKKILIDGGGSEIGSFDVGEKTLLPYLLDRRTTTLDYILISHFDTDHVGGILSILEKIKVKNIILSKQGEISENYTRLKEIVKEKKINIFVVKNGDKVKIEKDIYFDILFPEDKQIQENILNNNSIVAKLNYKKVSILFTGDIEAIAEERLLELNGEKLKSTILKVAHHGSKSSSIQKILDKIQPKIALIGVGEDNTFGHPNGGVLERLIGLRGKSL